VKSVLKSATGLQARKLAELHIPAFAGPDDPIAAAALAALRPSGGGLRANLRSLLRAGRPAKSGKGALAAAAALRAAGGAGAAPARARRGSGGGGLAGRDEGSDGAGSGAGSDGGGGALSAGSADYVELMRDAVRQKQRQQKAALLLGPVPPLPGSLGPPPAGAGGGGVGRLALGAPAGGSQRLLLG
jgi:hypothetical protein